MLYSGASLRRKPRRGEGKEERAGCGPWDRRSGQGGRGWPGGPAVGACLVVSSAARSPAEREADCSGEARPGLNRGVP